MSNHKPTPNTLILDAFAEKITYMVVNVYPSSVESGAATLGIVTESQGYAGVMLDLADATALRDHLNTLIEQAGAEVRVASAGAWLAQDFGEFTDEPVEVTC